MTTDPQVLTGQVKIAFAVHQMDEGGLASICQRAWGDRARPRRYEIAAALNRLRTLALLR